MSDSENSSEMRGDGDENAGRRQLPRGEREWSELLSRADRETARFLRFYAKSFGEAKTASDFENDIDRLDECALAMGWHLSDGGESETADGSSSSDSSREIEADAAPSPAGAQAFPEVYSLHNLPECIAIRAICDFARSRREILLDSPEAGQGSARAGTTLAETLSGICRDMTLAVDAEDALEFGLAICLTKKAHAALNRHFAEIIECFGNVREESGQRALRELRSALMDLRDICLRILRDSCAELEKQR